MNYFALVLASLIVLSTPWIVSRPFIGLLLVIIVNPFEALFELPAGLTLGRIAGVITVAIWFHHLSVDANAAARWRRSSIRSTIWMFPAVCLLSGVFNLDSAQGIDPILKSMSVILLAFMALMIENQVTTPGRMYALMVSIVVSSLFAVMFPLAYHFGYDLYGLVGYDIEDAYHAERARGLLNNANSLGILSAFGIFALFTAIGARPKPLVTTIYVFCGLAMLGGLVLSGSRTNLIAATACAGLFCLLRLMGPAKGRGLAVMGALVLVIAFPSWMAIAPERVQKRLVVVGQNVEDSTIERLNYTALQRQTAFKLFSDYPIVGVGLVNFQTVAKSRHGAHDTVSSLVGETGMLGVISFCILAISCVARLAKHALPKLSGLNSITYGYAVGLLAGFLAALLAGFGGYIVFYQRWFWIAIGLSSALFELTRHTNRAAPTSPQPLRPGGVPNVRLPRYRQRVGDRTG